MTGTTLIDLLKNHKPQLDMYAGAVRQALKLDAVEKYIYSTRHGKVVVGVT